LILNSFFEEANAVLHMASRLFPTLEQREMIEERVVARSRSAAFVSVMKSTDLLYRDNLAFVGHLDWAG